MQESFQMIQRFRQLQTSSWYLLLLLLFLPLSLQSILQCRYTSSPLSCAP